MAEFDHLTEYTEYPVHHHRLKWCFDTIKEKANGYEVSVVDVGCGTGNVTIPLGMLPNSRIVGIDMHQGNLDISVAANKMPNVTFDFAYFQDYDISSFDFSILTEVLEHIPNYDTIFEHFGKNAKQSAELLITIPNGWGPFEFAMTPLYWMRKIGLNGFIWKVKNLLGKKEPYSLNYDTPHVNFFTIPRLRRELGEYGLKIVKVEKSFILAPIIETYLPFIPLHGIAKIDHAIAQVMPAFLASGWYFRIAKK